MTLNAGSWCLCCSSWELLPGWICRADMKVFLFVHYIIICPSVCVVQAWEQGSAGGAGNHKVQGQCHAAGAWRETCTGQHWNHFAASHTARTDQRAPCISRWPGNPLLLKELKAEQQDLIIFTCFLFIDTSCMCETSELRCGVNTFKLTLTLWNWK